MWKFIAVSGTATAALVSAALLLGYSSAVCGCIPPALNLSALAGMGVPGNPVVMDPVQIEAGLNKELRGTQVTFGQGSFSRDEGCTQISKDLISCRVLVEESPLLKKGFQVQYQLAAGLVKKAEVSWSYWL